MKNKQTAENIERFITCARNGDIKAFEAVVSHYQSYIYSIAFRFLYNESDAEEIVQESFIRIWKHIAEFDGKNKFTTWLYKIAVNLCYDKAKSEERRKKLFTRIDFDLPFSSESCSNKIEKEFTDKEMAELIRTIAGSLSNKQRMIFLLRDIENLTVKEVSEITGMSGSAIKTNLFFARQNIRKQLIRLEVAI